MEKELEKLGLLIDDLDSLAHGLNIPLPPQMHVEQIKNSLTDKVVELKRVYAELAGENPWE